MNWPLVSAVIPVYNGEQFLAEAISSIYSQDYRSLEVIVVDDGSTDGTAEISRANNVVYIHQNNQGHGAAKNHGIAKAKGEFIAFLDADDVWAPSKIRLQVEYLMQMSDVQYTICLMKLFAHKGLEVPKELRGSFERNLPGYVPSALLARRDLFQRIGGFDESLAATNDSDWFFRANDHQVPMRCIEQVLLHRRIHKKNQSHEIEPSEIFQVLRRSLLRKRTG